MSDLPWFWLSYVNEETDTFSGVCIVQAPDYISAAAQARALNLSPGGQVLMLQIPPEHVPAEKYRNRLIVMPEIYELGQQLKDMES